MKTYEQLLDRAYSLLPETTDTGERFEPPTAEFQIEGNKTIITNFKQIAQTLHRDTQHFYKFITKELAAAGDIDGNRLIIRTKIPPRILSKKVTDYIKEYVICKECGKPDTKFVDIAGIKMLKCEACGARSSIKELK